MWKGLLQNFYVMKKLKLKDVSGAFPITLQMAKVTNRPKVPNKVKLSARSYQSDNVSSQQLYKPISKIISFQ